MLHRLEKLLGLPLEAVDGEIGKITDVYFDDRRWTVRYLVVQTGSWLAGRKVLISPISVNEIQWDGDPVRVVLTRQQVETSPNIDTDKPVSRQHELDFLDYYGYPYYWNDPVLWGTVPSPPIPPSPLPRIAHSTDEHTDAAADPHLRSVNEVNGYHLQTKDDSVGHVEDFLLDTKTWEIRYMVVDTRNWLPGKHVVVPPQWISRVNWAEETVDVDVSRATVQRAPEYNPATDLSRGHEIMLHRHYHRPGYWH